MEPRFTIGRFSPNELILFDESEQQSWIIYPPRSHYDFLDHRRPTARTTVVEFHPWAPLSVPVDHQLDARDACLIHGAACPANHAIQAAVALGFDPFA
jgi:hypothetical protein